LSKIPIREGDEKIPWAGRPEVEYLYVLENERTIPVSVSTLLKLEHEL
jgi:hypothetical protein